MIAKSLEIEPYIIPGKYKGIWTAYYVKIIYNNGNQSHYIKLDNGIRGVNISCDVTVDEQGFVYAE